MAKEFALGLPSKTRFDPIDQKGKTRLVIQEHNATTKHYDMRLKDKGTAHSWVIRYLPGEKQKILAIQQPTHLSSYMNFEGTIPEGYGAGTVKKIYDQKVKVLSATNDKIKMTLPEGNFTMIRPKKFGDRSWLMLKTSADIRAMRKAINSLKGNIIRHISHPLSADSKIIRNKNIQDDFLSNIRYGIARKKGKGLSLDELREYKLRAEKRVNFPYNKFPGNKIIASGKGGAVRATKDFVEQNPKLLSGKNKKIINYLGLMHEGFEANVKKPSNFFTHASPEVLLKEHNLITTLPKKYKSAGNYFRGIRSVSGESDIMQNTIQHGFEYGKSSRFSRHAIKRLTTPLEKVSFIKNYNEKTMNKQTLFEQIHEEAFKDELDKIANEHIILAKLKVIEHLNSNKYNKKNDLIRKKFLSDSIVDMSERELAIADKKYGKKGP
jgi:DNA ligase D-like protein (predicted 3'-phosphoesterase)